MLSINIVTNDRLLCNANKVHMLMMINIYAFLNDMGLFIQSSPKEIIFFFTFKTIQNTSDVDIVVSLLPCCSMCV